MSRHRDAPVRPRYGRIVTVLSSAAVTLIAVLGGTGGLSSAASDSRAAPVVPAQAAAAPTSQELLAPTRVSAISRSGGAPDTSEARLDPTRDVALPAGSGSGRRVVFSEGRQRVWLVAGGQRVVRTYLVSGSVYDNLDPGTYEVFSRSEQAWGIDDSGTMKYFVRFARGPRAAIGFHDIPVQDGRLVQGVDELGTPLSHGCIRQLRADAIALWDFAPLGSTVVVTT